MSTPTIEVMPGVHLAGEYSEDSKQLGDLSFVLFSEVVCSQSLFDITLLAITKKLIEVHFCVDNSS